MKDISIYPGTKVEFCQKYEYTPFVFVGNIEGNGPKSTNHFINHLGNFKDIPFLNQMNQECFSGETKTRWSMHPYNHNNCIVVDQTSLKMIFYCGEVGSTLKGLRLAKFLFWKIEYFLHHPFGEISLWILYPPI